MGHDTTVTYNKQTKPYRPFSVRDPLRGSQCLALFILAYIFPDLRHLHDRSPTYTPNRRTSALLVRKKIVNWRFLSPFCYKRYFGNPLLVAPGPIPFHICLLMYIECVGVIKYVKKPFNIRQLSQKSPIPRTKVLVGKKKEWKMTLNKDRKRPRKANVYKILVTDVFLCPTKSMLPSCSTLTGHVEHSATMLSISGTLTLNPSSRQRKTSSPSVSSIYTYYFNAQRSQDTPDRVVN